MLREALRRFGIDVIRYPHGTNYAVALSEALRECASVIDVGANEGQFGALVRQLGFSGPIVSFEPGSAAFAKVEARAAKDPDWIVRRTAAGDEARTATLRSGTETAVASLLPMAEKGRRRYGEQDVREEVAVARLDELEEVEHAPIPCLIKSDAQGYDLQVLRGAEGIIQQARAVVVELSVVPLYEGSSDWIDVLVWLRDHGFVPRAFEPVTPVEFDCLLVRPR